MTTNADGRVASDLCDQLGPLVEAAGMVNVLNHGSGSCVYSEGCHGVTQEHLERFAALVRADERKKGIDLCIAQRLTFEVGTSNELAYGEGVEGCIAALSGPAETYGLRASGLCDQLGALPEPSFTYERRPAGCEPERVGAYTADQLNAYAAQQVAAERERCARLIEPKNDPSDWTEYAHACAGLARMIRSGA